MIQPLSTCFTFKRLFILLGLLLLGATLASCASADNTNAIESRAQAPDVIFNGETYTYEEFEREVVPQHERIVFLDSRWLDEDRDVWYAFASTDELEAFAAANNVDLEGGSVQENIPSVEP